MHCECPLILTLCYSSLIFSLLVISQTTVGVAAEGGNASGRPTLCLMIFTSALLVRVNSVSRSF